MQMVYQEEKQVSDSINQVKSNHNSHHLALLKLEKDLTRLLAITVRLSLLNTQHSLSTVSKKQEQELNSQLYMSKR
jgi:hypothetical protein